MKGQLPSTASLQCFVAAVEHGNVTRAAEQLCLTQSAVSRQIKQLEDLLGRPLFERVRQRLVLTQAGARFHQQIAPVLDLLAQAAEEFRLYRPGESLVLGIEPALAGHWLLPQLPSFTDNFPDISIHLMTDIHKLYQRHAGCDLMVLFGRGEWPGYQVDYLMGDELVAVVSPSLVARLGPLTDMADLRRYPLLHHKSPESSSEIWWLASGLTLAAIREMPGQRLENFPLLLQAALQGMGVAILPWYFVADRIATGDLVQLGQRLACEGGYYLLSEADALASSGVEAFREWMVSLVKKT